MGVWESENKAVFERLDVEFGGYLPRSEYQFSRVIPHFRGAAYQLNYLNGCVFIDFGQVKPDQLYLSIISFDGYGACRIGSARLLDQELSKELVQCFAQTSLDQDRMWGLMKCVIDLNRDKLWSDALEEYGL